MQQSAWVTPIRFGFQTALPPVVTRTRTFLLLESTEREASISENSAAGFRNLEFSMHVRIKPDRLLQSPSRGKSSS